MSQSRSRTMPDDLTRDQSTAHTASTPAYAQPIKPKPQEPAMPDPKPAPQRPVKPMIVQLDKKTYRKLQGTIIFGVTGGIILGSILMFMLFIMVAPAFVSG